jgi:hypothetical protein
MDRAAAATRADRTADRGQPQVLDELQVRQSLQLLRRSLHWFLLVLASYLLIPLLLGYFPPTQVIAEGLRGQILRLMGGFLDAAVNAIPNLITIVVILAITTLLIRASNAWFAAVARVGCRSPRSGTAP